MRRVGLNLIHISARVQRLFKSTLSGATGTLNMSGYYQNESFVIIKY